MTFRDEVNAIVEKEIARHEVNGWIPDRELIELLAEEEVIERVTREGNDR